MKTITSTLFAVCLALILTTVNLFAAATEFPAGSIANNTVTAVQQVNAKSSADRATGAAAVPGILTAIEALDNTTTIPRNQLVAIRENIQAFRFLSDAIATRVDADIVLLRAIIVNHAANNIP